MLETLLHVLQFSLEAFILVIAILLLLAGIFAIASKSKQRQGALQVTKLNKHFDDLKAGIQQVVLKKKQLKKINKQLKKSKKSDLTSKQKTLFVVDFHGDIKASAVRHLREEISAILTVATPQDQVLLRLESAGGMVHAYGLAASQLQRLRDAHIPLLVSVDKVAASGGYMMACVAEHIMAAPFAVLGSIGVIAQIPNFHRLLKKNHIDFEQIQAGEYKRTLTIFGENTEAGREKFQEEINDTHELFKEFVQIHRPTLNMSQVATGEHWFGIKAKTLGLVDELITSDDYLLKQNEFAELIHVQFQEPKKLFNKFSKAATLAVDKLYGFIWESKNHKLNNY